MRQRTWLVLGAVALAALVLVIVAGVVVQRREGGFVPLGSVACPSLPPPDFVLAARPTSANVTFTVVAAPTAGWSWEELGYRTSRQAVAVQAWAPGAWVPEASGAATGLGLRGPVSVGDSFTVPGAEIPMVEVFHDGLLVGGSARFAVDAQVSSANVTLLARNPTNVTLAYHVGGTRSAQYQLFGSDTLRLIVTGQQEVDANADAAAPSLGPGEARPTGWTWPIQQADGSRIQGAYVFTVAGGPAFELCAVKRVEIT